MGSKSKKMKPAAIKDWDSMGNLGRCAIYDIWGGGDMISGKLTEKREPLKDRPKKVRAFKPGVVLRKAEAAKVVEDKKNRPTPEPSKKKHDGEV